MRGQLKAAGLAVAVALSTTGITGCQSVEEGVLTIGATAAPPTLDLVSNAAAAIPQVLLYNVYETLIRVDDSGKLVGLLAKSWQLSEDGLHLAFHLDPSARFASGAAVNSAAVKSSLERMRAESASPVNQANLSAVKAIRTPDDATVILDLSHRDNFLLFNLASTSGVVIDPATKDLATRPQGSGPYIVTEFTPGHSVTLSPSPRPWHEGGRPTVRFSYYSDPTSQTAALLSGDLDVVSDLTTPQALSRFTSNPAYRVLRGTTNGEVVLGMNNTSKPLSDRRVRQAILMAIDRNGLLDVVWNGQGTLIGSMVPPTDPWFTDLSHTWPYDPARARKLLAEAGYPNGLTLRLRAAALPYATAASRVVASDLAQIGITVDSDELEFPARWLDVVYTHADYDLTIVAHVEARDIVNWANPDYYWRYRNKEFNRLIESARTGPADRTNETMMQASRILATDAAGGFLFLMPKITISKAGISGLQRNTTSMSFDLTKVRRTR
ncbi:ABC transporter substrate-binding protein [Cutibacterium avidum]|uniref:ABC transporter substrate-binding protein n=1 Tax=Cutibacterium avidum TaxID=33010 RepID=UPI000763EC5D|nr:ABC transporter substrate-binding protein [Cutibacterium avidum]KXA66294.1 ABC transporter, substrate-binding protein, family 5 [Cutibacterium avidum]MCO6630606.1 ABC transporter substrate-binding protein [Cutibacterium avidum]MCO6659693.1 ABC transporter substrate-binding protein [Cutibacterium avidum]MCO6664126.1 ABC transporter substrate-binding protein [Cutibacterium avidum]MCT1415679.1 ABC transporter substrate-binding protein [Cutibacterium avidum]